MLSKFQTKADVVHDEILNKISNKQYKAGEKIVLRQLAKELNVSEIPVRDALNRLEGEGYLTHTANKSFLVCPLDINDLTNFFQVKGVLEGFAAKLSVDYLSEEDLKHLVEINDEMRIAFKENNTKNYSELNTKFHMFMYHSIPNTELINLLQQLGKRWSITKRVFDVAPIRVEQSIIDHEKIIELVKNKDRDGVEFCVREHKFAAGKAMIEQITIEQANTQE
ncbi:MAG: GntR family transcriptional regulator [Sphaerochaetaceae bacterium]|nr:GntR family transcriptional regulator [Sphaerochaetaceae bacterium]